jgi:GTP-binding protein
MVPPDGSDPADAAEIILHELEKFSPALMQRDRWLVLNKADQLLDEEREERMRQVVERLDWKGPVFVISALESDGTEALAQAIMRYLDERTLRIAEDPQYAEALAELDRQIEDEARARLQELDDQRALRRAGVKAADEVDDDDFDDDDDDEGGAEIFYVR